MALDGAMLSLIRRDLEENTLGARLEKIFVPSREEVVLALRWKGGSGKLILSAVASSARIHFTTAAIENPMKPPMFCMLLRKHLGNGKLVAVRQAGRDRILFLDFECINELGDVVVNSLCMEIMGRHSNIILIGPDGRVVDSIKRIGLETSSVRQILPGIRYEYPPGQDKMDPVEGDLDEMMEKIRSGRDVELSKAVQEAVMGFSPVLAREVAWFAARGNHCHVSELPGEGWERLRFYLGTIQSVLKSGEVNPTAVIAPDNKPVDFSFLDIHQYPIEYRVRHFEDFGTLLDFFYSERDRVERMRARSHDLLKLLANTEDRIRRRLAVQKEELAQSENRDQLKMMGDLISANLYTIRKGDREVTVENFYDPELSTVIIPLDTTLTPPQNAQKYYQEYRKADTAEKKLRTLVEEGEAELAYIESVFDALTRTSGESELDEIRQELADQRYIRPVSGKKRNQKQLPPLKYRSSDGFTILVGRNNRANDALTLRTAGKTDMWFHTQKIPGSHTVVLAEGQDIPDRTLEEAAIVAAYHSKARDSAGVPVDYAQVRHVRKPQGAKPGMVIYDHYQTAFVHPDEEVVRGLECRE